MPFCIKGCEAPPCDGIVSVQWNVSGSSTTVGGSCDTDNNNSGQEFVPGPITGSVTIQAYAFDSGRSDPWLGTRCVSRASANQSNIIKYDGKTNKHYVIPSSNHSAQVAGDPISGISLETSCGSVESYSSQLVAGSVTVSTRLGTDIGFNFSYSGAPKAISFPDKKAYSVTFGEGISPCYLSQFSLEIEYPNNPAVASYTWQFVKECEVIGGPGSIR